MDAITLGYALAVACGGIAGYLKAGSVASLVAGLSFGGLVALGAYLISIDAAVGHFLVVGAAGVLTFVMGKKFANSGKLFPAGIVTILSILILLRYAYNRFLH